METTIGQRLDAILAETGMQKKKLAEKIGVAESTITSYIKDVSVPPLEKLEKIAAVFPQYNWDWITRGYGTMEPPKSVVNESEAHYGVGCHECIKKDALIQRMQTEIDQKDIKIEELNRAIGGLMAGRVEGKREAC